MVMAPTKQRAALVTENGIAFGIADVPKPGPGQMLVKVAAAAQNPSDCQSSGLFPGTQAHYICIMFPSINREIAQTCTRCNQLWRDSGQRLCRHR